MKNIYFPTTIIDGFFEFPDAIREYGLDQLKNHPTMSDDNYPGKRSRFLHQLNVDLFNTICNKFLSVYFHANMDLNWNAAMNFQSVDQKFGSGWIHRDTCIATGIIYLTPNNQKNIGTSIYRQKQLFAEKDLFDLEEYKKQGYKNGTNAKDKRELANSNFEEVIRVEGVYNRALLFDGALHHAAHDFIGDDLDSSRLTIVTFFFGIDVGDQHFPIARSKIYQKYEV